MKIILDYCGYVSSFSGRCDLPWKFYYLSRPLFILSSKAHFSETKTLKVVAPSVA